MKNVDALTLAIMKEFARENDPVTFEEAQEMAKMELKEKQFRRYEKSNAPRKQTSKERKVNPNKLALHSIFANALNQAGIEYTPKNESEFHFTYCDENYTLKLIKHRSKK